MKRKTILVEITHKYTQNPNRPRPKWWDNFIGQTFRCYDDCDGWWTLSKSGLKKLEKLKGGRSYSAIINKDCGKIVNIKTPKKQFEKLVFDYTYCSEPEAWDWDIPFEYESKEKFIFDVLENPLILNQLGITVCQYQVDDKTIFEEDYMKDLDKCVLTIEEWFSKNKHIVNELGK